MDIKRKVINAIAGCQTEGQLITAINYANLAIKQAKSWERIDWLVCFERAIAIVQFKLNIAAKIFYIAECKND